MLFEQENLTPGGRMLALNRLFCELAARDGGKETAAVPLDVLKAHGELETHARYMIESAEKLCKDKERRRLLHKAEKALDALPAAIIQALPVGPSGDWMRFYRTLLQLHGLLEEAVPEMEAQEYSAILRKLVTLAGAVADAASVSINGASMFTLALIQVQLNKYAPKHRRRTNRRKKRKKPRSAKPHAAAHSAADGTAAS